MALPKYISDRGHGEIAYAAPLMISDTTAYAFVYNTDRRQLQAFVDDQLNAVSGGAVHYTATATVIHIWVRVNRATSTAEEIGWLPDRESMFWVPLWQKVRGELLPSMRVWVPYLFIDIDSGMVTGREVWGFRKTLASIDVPEDPAQASSFVAKTTIFPKFSTNTPGQQAEIVRTTRRGSKQPASSEWPTFEEAAGAIPAGVAEAGVDLSMQKQQPQPSLIPRIVHAINLKQYRDAVDSTKACYQALVDSPFKLENWYGGGRLPGDYELAISPCESHQIASDLGFAPSWERPVVVQPRMAFWWKMDFSTQPGSVVWAAT